MRTCKEKAQNQIMSHPKPLQTSFVHQDEQLAQQWSYGRAVCASIKVSQALAHDDIIDGIDWEV